MMHHVEFYTLKGHNQPASWDIWLRMSNGERFKTWTPGYLVDVAPALIVDDYRPKHSEAPVLVKGFAFDSTFRMPTLSLSLDVKKSLLQEGEEWLRIRIAAKVIKNGRYDAEVIVLDKEGDVVALGNHVCAGFGLELGDEALGWVAYLV
jgi:hypothetical protein